MQFPEILTKLMEENDISNVALGKELGVSHEAVRQWKTGKMIPALDKANSIADYFQVSLDYLMGRATTERLVSIPLVGTISAGPFDILTEDEWKTKKDVPVRLLQDRSQKECVSMEVVGDSMAPYLLEGDVLVVHRQTYAVNGNIIIAYDPITNGYTVKEYHQKGDTVILKPLNSDYKPMKFDRPDEQQLMLYGVCVGMERKLV